MRFAPYLIGLGLAGLAAFACSSTPTTTTAVLRPQLVAVDPDDFMGNVRCEPPPFDASAARAPDAVHSYVATLFDVTPDADGGVPNPGVPLASSPPTSCTQQATFSLVVENHRYVAEIDAYHEEPSELFPISPGSRLVNAADGSRALPGWKVAVCGGYAPSPSPDASAGSGAIGGGSSDATSGGGGTGGDTSGAVSGSGGFAGRGRPPGVISYVSITQTPHACAPVLEELTGK